MSDDVGEAWAQISEYYRFGFNQLGVAPSASATDLVDEAVALELRSGKVAELTLRLPESGRVRLEVERDGAPFPQAEIVLTEYGDRPRIIRWGGQYLQWGAGNNWAAVDEDGAIDIERVEPGSWLLGVRDRGARQVTTRRVMIGLGEQTIRVLFPAVAITGRVQLPDGTPVSGAHVTITSGFKGVELAMRSFHEQGYDIEEKSAAAYAMSYAGCAVSGQDGTFALRFMPEGSEIVVNATARGHTSVRSAAFVCDGTSVTLEPLVIEPAGTLRITAPADASDPGGVVAAPGLAAEDAFSIGQNLIFDGTPAVLRGLGPGKRVIYWLTGDEDTLEEAQQVEVEVIGGEIVDVELKMP